MRKFQRGDPLTAREREILSLIAHGQSAKEVALALQIMPRTVECHLDAVRMKLGARNRTHMVAIAIAARILPFEITDQRKAPICRSITIRRRTGAHMIARPLVLQQRQEVTVRWESNN